MSLYLYLSYYFMSKWLLWKRSIIPGLHKTCLSITYTCWMTLTHWKLANLYNLPIFNHIIPFKMQKITEFDRHKILTLHQLDGHAYSAAVSALGLYAPRFPLTPWIFSWHYVDGEIPKLFAILHWETFSLNWIDNSLTKFGTKWWTTTHPCLQRLSLWCSFYT